MYARNTRGLCGILGWVMLVAVAWRAAGAADDTPTRDKLFDAIHQLVADNFFDPALQGVDWLAASRKYRPAAINAPTQEDFANTINQMLTLLHTSHTRYFTPDVPQYYELLGVFASSSAFTDEMAAVREFLPTHEIGYVGIGIDTVATAEGVFIQSLYDGGPADQAGLLVGDRLVSVAGEPFHPVHSFRSRAGEAVEVTIQRHRDGPLEGIQVTPRFLDGATLFRESMEQSAHLITAGDFSIAYVHVWSYAGQAYQDLLIQLLFEGPLKDADALVLDLRDGWGGASATYLNLFNRQIPQLAMEKPRSRESVVLDQQWRRPVALLINERVRSGKEVFAWGFKQSGLGPVIGRTTAGAVVAGSPFFLPDHSVIYLAVADITVDGQRLEGQGVAPTVAVERVIPYSAGSDPQRDAGVEALTKLLHEAGR